MIFNVMFHTSMLVEHVALYTLWFTSWWRFPINMTTLQVDQLSLF